MSDAPAVRALTADSLEPERAAAADAINAAGNYAAAAANAGTRLTFTVNAIEMLFGIGLTAELRRRIDDVTENEAEARYQTDEAVTHLENIIDGLKQRHDVYRRQVATIRGDLEGDNARLRDELAVAKVKADEYAWLRDMLQGTLDHLERSAKRRGVRVPGIVGNLRRGLKVSDARVRIASDAS